MAPQADGFSVYNGVYVLVLVPHGQLLIKALSYHTFQVSLMKNWDTRRFWNTILVSAIITRAFFFLIATGPWEPTQVIGIHLATILWLGGRHRLCLNTVTV